MEEKSSSRTTALRTSQEAPWTIKIKVGQTDKEVNCDVDKLQVGYLFELEEYVVEIFQRMAPDASFKS